MPVFSSVQHMDHSLAHPTQQAKGLNMQLRHTEPRVLHLLYITSIIKRWGHCRLKEDNTARKRQRIWYREEGEHNSPKAIEWKGQSKCAVVTMGFSFYYESTDILTHKQKQNPKSLSALVYIQKQNGKINHEQKE